MRKDKLVYNFAKEYTKYPGPGYKSLGEFSGERFREEILRNLLDEYEYIEIDASNVLTFFSPSFLVEAFGILAREIGIEEFLRRVRLYSTTTEKLEEKFRLYVKE